MIGKLFSKFLLTAVVCIAGVAHADPLSRGFFTIWVDDGLTGGTMKSLVVFNTMGIKGTFCIPTGFLNQPGHITSSELLTIAAAGSDICGHTISHLSLLQPINAFTLLTNPTNTSFSIHRELGIKERPDNCRSLL